MSSGEAEQLGFWGAGSNHVFPAFLFGFGLLLLLAYFGLGGVLVFLPGAFIDLLGPHVCLDFGPHL